MGNWPYRFVWDPHAGRTHLVEAGASRRTLSGSVGRIAAVMHSGDPASVSRLRSSHPKSIQAMEERGWLAAEFRQVPRAPHLKRVQIEVSLRCNLQCSYCYSASGPWQRDRLETEQVLRLIDEADRMGVLWMDFTGGELLIDPSWREYVTAARSRGIAVTIHTNGTLIKEAEAEFLRDADVAAVQVSLDSHLPELHDEARGRRGALRRTLAGLDALDAAGLPVRLSVMAHRGNIDTLGDTITYMAERYPRATLNVDRVVATGGALIQGNGLDSREFYGFLSQYLSPQVRAGRVCESPGIEDYEPECGVAYSYVYITAQGEIAACPTMTSRESRAFRGPHVDRVGLAEAWYDSTFFNGFRYTNCENVTVCPAGAMCGGGCRSNAYVEFGSVTAPDVVACNINKNSTTTFVDFPARYARGEFTAVSAG